MSLASEVEGYKDFILLDRGFSPRTVRRFGYALSIFLQFASSKGANRPRDLTRDLLSEWAQEMAFRVGIGGGPIKVGTRILHLEALRGFLRFLFDRDLMLQDLTRHVLLPKSPRRLPREILEPGEVDEIVRETPEGDSVGLRDRVIFEVLYSSGLRASELSMLKIEDVDYEGGLLYVREGKGGKDRVVPLGKIASQAIRAYLASGRSAFLRGPDPGTLLLNKRGRPLREWTILKVVKAYAKRAGLRKKVTTHSFRRTCATLMLRDGANIRAIQDMLGHEDLSTTAVYLKVSAREVKAEHEKHHPREKGTAIAGSDGGDGPGRASTR